MGIRSCSRAWCFYGLKDKIVGLSMTKTKRQLCDACGKFTVEEKNTKYKKKVAKDTIIEHVFL